MRTLVLATALAVGLASSPAAAGDPKESKSETDKAKPADDKKAKADDKAKKREEAKAKRRAERAKRILNQAALEKTFAPHVPALQVCYKSHAMSEKAANGVLRLEMIIVPVGTIRKMWVTAPGVKGVKLKQLKLCVDKLTAGLQFPERPGFTHAAIPFFFLKTDAKGAGPIMSCWNPRGCPSKKRSRKKAKPTKKDKPDKKDTKSKKDKKATKK